MRLNRNLMIIVTLAATLTSCGDKGDDTGGDTGYTIGPNTVIVTVNDLTVDTDCDTFRAGGGYYDTTTTPPTPIEEGGDGPESCRGTITFYVEDPVDPTKSFGVGVEWSRFGSPPTLSKTIDLGAGWASGGDHVECDARYGTEMNTELSCVKLD